MNSKDAYAAKPWLRYYPEGVVDTVDVPAVSVPALFDQVAEKYGNKTALIFYGNKISLHAGHQWKVMKPRNSLNISNLQTMTGRHSSVKLSQCWHNACHLPSLLVQKLALQLDTYKAYHLNILGREGYACEGRHAEGDQQEKDLAGWWGSVLAHRSREFKDHLPKKQRSEHRQIVLG